MRLEIELPRKARDTLFPPARFKVLYGGRDSAKSWSMARMLLVRGRAKPERILCTREVQKSIAESVHQLLKDQVTVLGLEDFYDVQQNYIHGKNGTQFSFHGLSGQTATSIKSFEGTTICWVEEAQVISKRSWDLLEPTIRTPNSEIWVSFNPDMDTDETYKRFVANGQPNSIVTKINWQDNPWRSTVLDAAREKMRLEAPDDYAHIYEGECRPAVEGAIYYNEVAKLRSSGRLCNVPYDPMLRVHVVCDLGFNDYMSMILTQRLASEIRVIRYIEDRMRYIPSYHQELTDLKLNYGKLYLPHDGKAKHITGSSAEEQFRALGWDVEIIPDIGVEQGIRKTREIFSRLYVDKEHAGELLNRLGRYRRRVNSEGQAYAPVHDDESHGCFEGNTKVWTRNGMSRIMDLPETGEVLTSCGWKRFTNPRMTKRNAQLVEVVFGNGYSVRCTPDHLFKTASGWRSARSLMEGFVIQSGSIRCLSISRIAYTAFGLVNDISRVAMAGFTVMCGALRSVLSQADVTFTTGMVIPETMRLRTWNASNLENISELHGNSTKLVKHSTLLKQLGNALLNGTLLKRGVCGTVGTLGRYSRGTSGLANLVNAFTVRMSSNAWLGGDSKSRNTVAPTAKPMTIESVRGLRERSDVWDITVPESHEFCLENGAVVHNSDGTRYLAIVADQMSNDTDEVGDPYAGFRRAG